MDDKVKRVVQVFLLGWFVIASAFVFIPAASLLVNAKAGTLQAVYVAVVHGVLTDLLKAILTSLLAYAFVKGAANLLEKYLTLKYGRSGG